MVYIDEDKKDSKLKIIGTIKITQYGQRQNI